MLKYIAAFFVGIFLLSFGLQSISVKATSNFSEQEGRGRLSLVNGMRIEDGIEELTLNEFSHLELAYSRENFWDIYNISDVETRRGIDYKTYKSKGFIPPTEVELALTVQQVSNYDCATVTDVTELECKALVALYASTNGAGWVDNTNWLVGTEVSSWYGIGAYDGHITYIILYLNNLVGTLPAQLGDLRNLESLWLFANQLYGSIPSTLGNLENLRQLRLDENQLSGYIPSALGNLGKLEDLYLHNNQLYGSIPSTLGDLENLRQLLLFDNKLSGYIPSTLGNLGKLETLWITRTQLTGPIPLSFVNLSSLSSFVFEETSICEPTTPEFLAWKSTVREWFGTGITCSAVPTLSITHVEWTQAIQGVENDIPLVAGKDTLVRVFVKSSDYPIRAITGTLIGKRNGVILEGTPTSWVVKKTYSGSINFILPKAWTTAGNLELTINIADINSQVKNLVFNTAPGIKVVYIPIEYEGATIDKTKMAKAVSWMRDAYPNSNIIYDPGIKLAWDEEFKCKISPFRSLCNSNDILNILTRLFDEKYQNYDFIVGWIPNEANEIIAINGASDPLWNDGAGKAVWVGEWSNMGIVIAHELGHLLDQHHTNTGECFDLDSNTLWPYPWTAHIDDTGWRAGTTFFMSPTEYYELMSYCYPRWISKYTYKGIYDYWNSMNTASLQKAALSDSVLVISGLVFTDDEVILDPIWERTGVLYWNNPPSGSGYCIQLLDDEDVVLHEQCFDLNYIDPETFDPTDSDKFITMLPIVDNLSRVQFMKGDFILATQDVSMNSPQVTLVYPNGSEIWGADETQVVSWIGNDPDGDTLHYNLYYSADDGLSWIPIAIDLDATSFALDTSYLPGSSHAKIKVAVTDGIHKNQDESDMPFSVMPKKPLISIIHPEDNSSYLAGRYITLRGIGYDLEDGVLEMSKMCWSSNLDGVLGCGETLTTLLTVGEHEISLQAEDSDGNLAYANVSIDLIDCYELNTYTTPTEAGNIIINIAPNCSADPELYAKGTEIGLNLESNLGFTFIAWGDSISGSELPKMITITEDFLVNAIFEQTSLLHLPLVLR